MFVSSTFHLYFLEERSLRVAGYDSIVKQSALIPFMDLEKMSSDVLQSVTNFLRTELSTLEHNIHFWIAQYQLTHKKFEEANRIRLSKLDLQDKPMAEPESTSSVPEAQAGPSSAAV